MACSVFLLVSCAKMGMPPGGAEDKTGPAVLSHFPAADAVNAPRKMTATIEFTETVNRGSVESSLFLAPEPGNRLKYRWRGRMLDLIYLDSLAENRTYVITIGSAVKDQRGNPAGQPFTFAFSTGAQIDRGQLSGLVSDEETPSAISIWAYDLLSHPVPDPAIEIADYVLQPDGKGLFRFGYLRTGNYRVFAVHDRNHDRTWNIEAENIGIPPWDVSVSDTAESYVSFRLSNLDTSALRIVRSKEIDLRRVEVRLSKESDQLFDWNFKDEQGVEYPVNFQYRLPDERDTYRLFTTQPLSAEGWRVVAMPRTGDRREMSDSLTVRAKSDTSRPKILSQNPAEQRPAVTLAPLSITWDEPVILAQQLLDSSVVLSSEQDTHRVVLSASAIIDTILSLQVTGDPPFVEGSRYTWQFDGRWIKDLDSNTFADTTTQFSFAYYALDSLGAIRGAIANAPRQVHVTLKHAESGTVVTTAWAHDGKFELTRLVPGDYLVEIVGADSTAAEFQFPYGTLQPFQFSAPFIIAPDTISVRARWETETTIRWDIHP